MLKYFSSGTIVQILGEVVLRSGQLTVNKRGRPCEVRKELIFGYILFAKISGHGYEQMEMDSELFLGKHYDHSTFQYHYSNMSSSSIIILISLLEVRIKQLIDDVYLHIFDSTALSTSVREERLRQGTRNKEKLTTKFHTMLGYDPPNQLVIVEGALASDNHLSDAKGAELMMADKEVKGYCFGDSAFETYGLIDLSLEKNLNPIFKPTKKSVRKKLSAKAKLRKIWNGNHSRLYKEVRGTGEVLYGAATKAKLIHTNSIREDNREKDSLIIGLRQNLFTYLRLLALLGIIRKTRFYIFSGASIPSTFKPSLSTI